MIRPLVPCLAIAALLSGATILAAQERPAPAKAAQGVAAVNINTATAAQIATLPGIGPTTAQRIVEHREKNGAFKKVEELMNVKGIGEKTFLKLKPLVTVGEGKTAARD